MLNILGVITARGGSKTLPGKNIKVLVGKPLIAYTIESAKKSKLLSHLIVSTDDSKIAQIAKEHGAAVPFLRPKELAQDDTSHLPVMRHAILFMEKKLGIVFNYAVVLQPTSPFRTADDIDETLKILIDEAADSAVCLVKTEGHSHPMKMKKLEGRRVLPFCIDEPEGTRRQDLPECFRRNGAVYAMRRDLLVKEKRLYGDHIVGYVMPKERSIDIDDQFDFLKAEYLLRKLQEKEEQF